MSVIQKSPQQAGPSASETQHRALTETAQKALAVLRIAFGFTFLWAFVDKLFALGFSTGTNPAGGVDRFGPAAWIHGGSPTLGFLKFGADGPFKGFWNSLGGTVFADWGFMLGLLAIGVALILGVTMRIAAGAGTLMCLLMFTVALPPETNPLIDDHILGAISMVILGLVLAGDTWGFGKRWAATSLVRDHSFLR